MSKETLITKKFKILAIITLILCVNYVIFSNILKNKNLGLRLSYYKFLIISFLVPLIILIISSLIVFYKRFFKINIFLKILGIFFL